MKNIKNINQMKIKYFLNNLLIISLMNLENMILSISVISIIKKFQKTL